MSKIIELSVANFMGVEAVEVIPLDHIVTIGGKNGAGKSSVLNAMIGALQGRKALPQKPLRNGAEKGNVRVVIDRPEGQIIVELVLTDGRDPKLTIKSADGAMYKRPQEMLDALIGEIGFDPHAFMRLDPKKQADKLRALVGLDFSVADKQRQAIYDERTIINRQAKAIESRFSAMPVQPDAPKSEVSVSELMAELQRREAINVANAEKQRQHTNAVEVVKYTQTLIDDTLAKIEALQNDLARMRDQQVAQEAARDGLAAEVSALQDVDLAEIRHQIATAEETNSKVRVNRERTKLKAELDDTKSKSDDLTKQIEAIDADKTKQMAEAPWPVPGLGFDADGCVTFNDLPFSQASTAEQLQVSLAIGMRFNPELRVLVIRDGSLIDDDTMQVIRDLAEQHGFQVWVERVSSNGDGCSIVISEGKVVETAEVAQ